MRYLLSVLIIISIISCNQEVDKTNLKRITLTTSSEEARIFFYEALEESEQNSSRVAELLKSALLKDPDFILAKALLNSPFTRWYPNNFIIVSDIYNNSLDNISEMEGLFIKAYYHIMTGEYDESKITFDQLKEKYPDYPMFWLYSGVTQSFNGDDVKKAIIDLEKTLELDPNNFLANAYLMGKHIVVGNIGEMLPAEERDLKVGKKYIDRMNEINPNNSFGVTMAGNYERSIGNFEKALEYYAKVGEIPSQDNVTVFSSNHYQALVNTFLKDYEKAESLFQSNIDYGNGSYQRQALGFMGNLHVFAGDFDRAIDALDNYISVMPNLELPKNTENYQLANVHFNKFLCYSHNQQESESLEEINSYINYRNDILENNKESLNSKQYNLQKNNINNELETLKAWHDILFGRYDDARIKLELIKQYGESQLSTNNAALYDYNALSGMIYLNEGDFEKAKLEFEKNIGQTIGYLVLDTEYFDYFYALSLKGSGNDDEAIKVLNRIANNNFYGYTRALVRDLAKSQI
ncbi:MAG: tetratricopeptide repeat protein [Cytophagales bacterium]|tara:strand:+ start:331 stop:1896 length:1566 start_codon:yes stop_codon:yes gene_type:complete